MNAIRLFTEVKDGKIAVDLPEGMRVEVFVIPVAAGAEDAQKGQLPPVEESTAVRESAEVYYSQEENSINSNSTLPILDVQSYAQPPREEVSIDMIIAEQGNKKFDYPTFQAMSSEIEWEESIEELIEMVQELS